MERLFSADYITMDKQNISSYTRLALPLYLCILLVLPVFGLAAEDTDPGLVAVGTLSASNLYLSYLVLGTVADGFVNGSYDLDTTRSIILETIFLNGNAQTSLKNLSIGRKITTQDREIVLEMLQSYNILDNMANALIEFIDKEDNGASYQAFRQKAWDNISSLLGL